MSLQLLCDSLTREESDNQLFEELLRTNPKKKIIFMQILTSVLCESAKCEGPDNSTEVQWDMSTKIITRLNIWFHSLMHMQFFMKEKKAEGLNFFFYKSRFF